MKISRKTAKRTAFLSKKQAKPAESGRFCRKYNWRKQSFRDFGIEFGINRL